MRIGIIGTGRIASRFADTAFAGIESAYVSCVYNPKAESAEKFAIQHRIENYTDSLEELTMLTDAVYIASLHETHYEYAKYMLNNKKHVLCEKPAVLKKAQAEELYSLAKENNVVFMEAVKTAYCPGFHAMMAAAKSGKIGRIIDVEAAFSRLTPVNTREYMAQDYNGSFLEFGSYVCMPVFELLGCDYDDVRFHSMRAVNGVDAYTKAVFSFGGKSAEVKTGLGVKTEGQLLISGTNGYILAKSPWWLTKEFEIRYEDPNKKEVYKYAYEGSGLQYELKNFINNVNNINKINESDDLDSECRKVSVWTGAEACTNREISIATADVMEKFIEWNRPQVQEKQKKLFGKDIKKPRVWAYRGCCTLYPENTLESFKAAAELKGITGVELDIQFSKDKKIVVFHDENASRVTGIDKNIKDCTLDELKSFKMASNEGRYAQIPTLTEVLGLLKPYCENNGLLINIELKTSKVRYEGIEDESYKLVKSYGMEKYIVWSSFLADSVSCIKKIDKDAKTGVLAGSLEDCIAMAQKTGAEALHPYIGGLVFELPEHMKDMPVRAWNGEEPFFKDGRPLKEPDLNKYRFYGATDIFTNMPERYLDEQ